MCSKQNTQVWMITEGPDSLWTVGSEVGLVSEDIQGSIPVGISGSNFDGEVTAMSEAALES